MYCKICAMSVIAHKNSIKPTVKYVYKLFGKNNVL